MTDWKEIKLGEVAEVKYGKAHQTLDNGSIPAYGSGGLMRYVEKALYDDESILIPRKGTLNNIMYKNEPFWTVDTMFYTILNKKIVFPKFLFYQLTTVDFANMNVGSAVPSMTVPVLNDLDILLPPLPEQTAIAEVLSSIDDKIDLLHRQNKTLEQLAETLFRQWFVESEKLEMKSGKLGDVIKTTSGGTPSRNKMEYYSNGIYRWVKSKELAGSFIFETEEKITEDALKNSSAKLLPANSILIAMYGATVGEFGILANEATCNQAICALIPNENYPYTYLFLLTKTSKENLLNLAVGSAQQNISQLLIKEIEVSADKKLVKEFHKEVEPMFQKIKSNTNQIKTLTRLRDTLLPKLMSGEVRVKEKNHDTGKIYKPSCF